MILDADLLFSKEQKVTATAESTAIDLGEAGDAVGQELTIRAVITEAFTGLTSMAIKLQTGDDGSSFTDVLLTPAIPVASLVKGAEVFCVRVPKGLKRYVRLHYDVTGSGTAGKITAFMSKEL